MVVYTRYYVLSGLQGLARSLACHHAYLPFRNTFNNTGVVNLVALGSAAPSLQLILRSKILAESHRVLFKEVFMCMCVRACVTGSDDVLGDSMW